MPTTYLVLLSFLPLSWVASMPYAECASRLLLMVDCLLKMLANKTMLTHKTMTRTLPWLVWTASLLLYIVTSAPSIVEFFDDSLEFQLVGPSLGIAHPTGYPLYTLLGAFWSRVLFPVGNWAWRMNLLSALIASWTVLLVFLVARRLTLTPVEPAKHLSNVCGLAAAIAFAISPVWWSQATIAEVYALHNLFVALILFAALKFTPSSPPPLLLSLLLGFALTHHRTSILLIPGLLIYTLWTIPRSGYSSRQLRLCGVALLTPLLLYAYLPIRAAMGVRDLNGSYQNTLAGFWDHAVLPAYTSFFQENSLAVARGVGDWIALFQQQVGWMGLTLAALGLLWLGRIRQNVYKGWWLIVCTLLVNLLFAINYRVPDVEVFLLPVFLCTALLVGGGIHTLHQLVRSLSGRIAHALPTVLPLPQFLVARRPQWWKKYSLATYLTSFLLLTFASGPLLRHTVINRSHDWDRHDWAVAMAKADFPPNSRLIGLEGEATALKYMQQAVGLGRNATAMFARDNSEATRRALIADALAAGYAVYLTRELPGIETQYSFSGEGPLVRVWPRGEADAGRPQHELAELMAAGLLRLEGYDLEILAEAGGPTLRLALYWRPTTQLAQRLKVSLRLRNSNGEPVPWSDGLVNQDRFPLHQVAHTDQWVPGERVRDVHSVRLPLREDSQPLQLLLIVYDAETLAEVGRWEVALPVSE